MSPRLAATAGGRSVRALLLTAILGLLSSGCAVHVQDASGTEHIWGVGGMALREVRSPEGIVAAARRTTLFGLTLGRRTHGSFVSLGWQRWDILDVARDGSTLEIVPPDGWLGYASEDPVSGARHYWGLGHLRMRASVPRRDHAATIEERRAVGVAGSFGTPGRLLLGWERTHQIVPTDADVAVRLEWSSGRLLDARIGTRPPLEPDHGTRSAREGD